MKMSPRERWKIYLEYLEMKIDEGDWHGVMDAAADLRELEAAHPHLKPNPGLGARVSLALVDEVAHEGHATMSGFRYAVASFLAFILGHAAPPEDPEANRRRAIERELEADDWLIYCAQENILCFESWWQRACFHQDVIERFARTNPGAKPPLKDEIGRVLEALIRREGAQLYLAPVEPGWHDHGNGIKTSGGSVLKRRNR